MAFVPVVAVHRRPRAVLRDSKRRNVTRPSMSSSLPEGEFDFNWEVMQQRMKQLQEQTSLRDQEVTLNWKRGHFHSEIVARLDDDYVRRCAFWGPTLVCGSHRGDMYVFDMQNRKQTWRVDAHKSSITALHFDGTHFASGAVDGTIRICGVRGVLYNPGPLKAHAGAILEDVIQKKGIVTAVQIHGGRREILSASVDGWLRVWELKKGVLRRECRVSDSVLCGQLVGNYILLGCRNGRVEVYTVDKLQHILSIPVMSSNVTCIAYDESTERLVVGGADGAVRMWSLPHGKLIRPFDGHEAPVMSLQFDDEKIVSGGRDGTLRVWNAESGRAHFIMSGLTAYHTSLQFDRLQLIADGTNNVIARHRFCSLASLADEEKKSRPKS